MMAFITRATRLRKALAENPDKIIVTERSVFTDREIFAKMLHDAGKVRERSSPPSKATPTSSTKTS